MLHSLIDINLSICFWTGGYTGRIVAKYLEMQEKPCNMKELPGVTMKILIKFISSVPLSLVIGILLEEPTNRTTEPSTTQHIDSTVLGAG